MRRRQDLRRQDSASTGALDLIIGHYHPSERSIGIASDGEAIVARLSTQEELSVAGIV